jgi:pimeloyl-ACP methyl ester carboxylesterase
VLPGFNTSDRSTRPLRRYLAALGYEPHGWGLGRNLGPGRRVVAGMEELLAALTADGSRISVVGWSLGGLYAREMARDHPTSVRYVATLGSPFRMRDGDASTLSALLEKRFKKNFDAVEPPREEDRTEMSVPSSAIYSRTDGFVRPHLCIDESSPLHENIEVRGSHMGLVVNPAVYYALAHRLHAVSDGNLWTSFAAPATARLAYPRPLSWDIARVAGRHYVPSPDNNAVVEGST